MIKCMASSEIPSEAIDLDFSLGTKKKRRFGLIQKFRGNGFLKYLNFQHANILNCK